jgi:hypothetical protein
LKFAIACLPFKLFNALADLAKEHNKKSLFHLIKQSLPHQTGKLAFPSRPMRKVPHAENEKVQTRGS